MTEVKYIGFEYNEGNFELYSMKIFWQYGTERFYVKLSECLCSLATSELAEDVLNESSNHRLNKICEQLQINECFNKKINPHKFLLLAERGIKQADKEVSNVVKFRRAT